MSKLNKINFQQIVVKKFVLHAIQKIEKKLKKNSNSQKTFYQKNI